MEEENFVISTYPNVVITAFFFPIPGTLAEKLYQKD